METYKHWTPESLLSLDTLQTFAELREVAFMILKNMPQPITEVCGPITTGGKGSIEANLNEFGRAIGFLVGQEKNIFDQRPFETHIARIRKNAQMEGYPYDLLEDFYLPIFESGLISEFVFLTGWEDSTGARWEHEQAKRLGINITYLPENIYY